MLDVSIATILLTFSAGVLMFLAPCTFPLVPAFLASLIPESGTLKGKIQTRELVGRTFLFVIGFTSVFVLFGVVSGYLGATVAHYKNILSQIGGFIIIIFGLSLLNVFELPLLNRSKRVFSSMIQRSRSRFTPFILGIVFALGWTPCAGPILASILLLAAQSSTAVEGGVLLLIFSLGLSIPFLIVGFLYAHTFSFLSFYGKHIQAVSYMSGLILVILGVILLFGQSFRMTELGFALYGYLGYVPMCSYF